MIMPSTSVMDLLSRLETLLRGVDIKAGSRSPKTEEALGLVRMIRGALPAELSEFNRLRAEAERIDRHAQDEARRIVLEAQATARRQTNAIAPQTMTSGRVIWQTPSARQKRSGRAPMPMRRRCWAS